MLSLKDREIKGKKEGEKEGEKSSNDNLFLSSSVTLYVTLTLQTLGKLRATSFVMKSPVGKMDTEGDTSPGQGGDRDTILSPFSLFSHRHFDGALHLAEGVQGRRLPSTKFIYKVRTRT